MAAPGRTAFIGAAAAALVVAVVALVLAVRSGALTGLAPGGRDAVPGMTEQARAERREQLIRHQCSRCHVYAPPDILPAAAWPHTIRGMYSIADARGTPIPIPYEDLAAWYIERAPQRLPPAPGRTDAGPGGIAWRRDAWAPPGAAAAVAAGARAAPDAPGRPTVGHVRAARLFDGRGLDLIVSDMSSDRIWALRPYLPGTPAVLLGVVSQPTRVAVTDLDGDGRIDVVAAGVGQMLPTNAPVGSLVWLRRTGAERFETVPLLDGIGRVGDVAAADLTGDGRTDLVVAVFGWQTNGGLIWLENQGTAGGAVGGRPDGAASSAPRFVRHVLDGRPGFIDVRVVDLDGDGRLDIVAAVAQESQQVLVWWGTADGFRADPVFTAPDPDWGLIGLEVVDFTGDGRPDIVVTNGDGLDVTVAKPQHGVSLLRNAGGRRFEYHRLTHMYGAHRAEPVDLRGDGRLGLLVAAYLPGHLNFGHPDPPEAIVWLERVGPTRLVRRVLQREGTQHMTLTAGDLTGDGRTDFAAGWMDLAFADTLQAYRGPPLESWVTLWRNLGSDPAAVGAAAADTMDWR